MTPEERVERVKMALAEAGYPDASPWIVAEVDDRVHSFITDTPMDVWWRALAVSGEVETCWPCWSADPVWRGQVIDCDHDPFTSPWPEVVR